MPLQHERETCARDRRTATKLRDIADEIYSSRNLVEAAYLAAHNLEDHQRAPLVELLSLISKRLSAEADAILVQAEASHQEGSTDAA